MSDLPLATGEGAERSSESRRVAPPRAPLPGIGGRTLHVVAVVLAVGAIAVLTLRPGPGSTVGWLSFCIVCGSLAGRDIVLNVLLFAPLGAALRWARVRRFRALAGGWALSVLVEALQATVIPGRDSTVGDIVFNTVGTALGIALVDALPLLVRPPRRIAERLAAAAAAVWLVVAVGGAVLSRPSTRPSPYFGQWARVWPYTGRFTGKVLSFTIDGSPIPDDRITNLMTLRGLLLGDTMHLRATAMLDGEPARMAPIVSVANRDLGTVLLIGQRGRDVVLRTRLRAGDARLRSPELVLRDLIPAGGTARHDTLRVTLDASGEEMRWCAAAAGTRRCQHASFGAASGWLFVVPLDFAVGGELALVSALWIALVALPGAYWAAIAGPRPFAALCALGVVTFVAIPVAAGAAWVDAPAWMGTAAGLACGWLVTRRRRSTG